MTKIQWLATHAFLGLVVGGCLLDDVIAVQPSQPRGPDSILPDAALPDGAVTDAAPTDAALTDGPATDASTGDATTSCGGSGQPCCSMGVCDVGFACSGGSCTAATLLDSAALPPSCAAGGPGLTNCGTASDSCCTSLEVVGGTFYRTYSYDSDSGLTGERDPATVSSFRLDKYDVTVGRFRQFVSAWEAGYAPPPGSGKHSHLNAGQGLVDSEDPGTYEQGWVASYDDDITPTNANLACDSSATWTNTTGSQENLPINCVDWFESYAFCIWDGGFLPSYAEWEYAAAGGDQQRQFPWGSTLPGTGSQYAIYGLYYTGNPTYLAPVGYASLGAGYWGQLDLVGDVFERELDLYNGGVLVDPCVNCANVGKETSPTWPTARWPSGDDFEMPGVGELWTSGYNGGPGGPPTLRTSHTGFRCARAP
jgi:formylglycine-generating enzyme